MGSRLQKTALLAATFLILATIVGAAFAMWSETLKINVIIVTGEVDVEWSDYWHNDTIEKPEANLDVTTVNISEEEYDDGDLVKLKVEINNAYPSYKVGIYGMVDNIGTIPVKLESAKLLYDNKSIDLTLCTWYDLDFDGDGEPEVNVHLELSDDGDGDGIQIDPDSYDTYELVIHIKQEALENTTYTFELQLTFAQWNEVT
ncbi:MAG: hypothetical protein DRO18_02710 [Thermoprotei archaeon]|mgnify:CR=1 FL=1|nr:MAG: hypothetical protein DRO18_02710 [Thermoprotei archaeon]